MTTTEAVLTSELENAWQQLLKSNLSEALDHAKKASIIAPDSPEVAHVLGVIASRDYRHDIALPLLQKALDAGISDRKLRDMAEALLLAGHPEAALAPAMDAIKQFGESPETLGVLAAIHVALNHFETAEKCAIQAVQLKPHFMAWDSTVAFCQLLKGHFDSGFKWFTGRAENRAYDARCPALMNATPSDIYLKNEEGPGDTLFFLRYAPFLKDKGFKLHIRTDKKTKALLNTTPFFTSVKEQLTIPHDAFWLNMGDLPLAAIQAGSPSVAPAIPLQPDPKRIEKIKDKLNKIGPGPYVAVTWRAGPKGKKLENGIRKYHKFIDPSALGHLLSGRECTVISVQRLPDSEESKAFQKSLGRDYFDYNMLNDQLQDMLALMSLVDLYITVPNTNVHLRQSVQKKTFILLNQPWQDWRWLAEGGSPWYPDAHVFRQSPNGEWSTALDQLNQQLDRHLRKKPDANQIAQQSRYDHQIEQSAVQNSSPEISHLVHQGWQAADNRDIPKAIHLAQQIMSLSSNHPEALHLLGWTAFLDQKSDLAISILKQAYSSDPHNVRLISNLCRILVNLSQFEQANTLLNHALNDIQITNKSALILAKGYLNVQQNNLPEAAESYEQYLKLNPDNMDIHESLASVKLKIGATLEGFKLNSYRRIARNEESRAEGFMCPILQGDLHGMNILINHDMGLGDELTFLRYLPWLTKAGAHISYSAGKKLVPILERHQYADTVFSNETKILDKNDFDLSFWMQELPVAVSLLGAPAIPPSLPLKPRQELIDKWQAWLYQQGQEPYIGINWKAGVQGDGSGASFGKLAKEINWNDFADALSGVNATFISLQRNIMLSELEAFEQILDCKVADAASITDDLEDLLALLWLLDENIGVSNTNMHLRASLGKNSRVMVQCPGGDWRWGYQGKASNWFPGFQIYRQDLHHGWKPALTELRQDLIKQHGQKDAYVPTIIKETRQQLTKRILWVTAGKIIVKNSDYSSDIPSALERVIAPSLELAKRGWRNEYINEGIAQVMGGWCGMVPHSGDIVVISKVFTEFAIRLAEDARARGAIVVLDIFNDHHPNSKPDQLFKKMLPFADAIVSIESLKEKWQKTGLAVQAYIEHIKEANPNEMNARQIEAWEKLFLETKKSENQQISKYPLNSSQPRVLIGIMYSGENEFNETLNKLKSQKYQQHEYFVIKDLPNKEAHDTLYAHFMENAGGCEYFLKLDADMQFATDDTLAEMIEVMKSQELSHLFAWVYDCPSSIQIPGIQMFASDTQWMGSNEQLNVDYPPKITGKSAIFTDKDWIRHMPNPSEYQMFRYGIHKAVKSLQPDREEKNIKKGILHLSILNGIARNAIKNNDKKSWFALIGATLVYNKIFNGIHYNSEKTKKMFDDLNDHPEKFEKFRQVASTFWAYEVKTSYWWLDNFNNFKFDQ